MFPAAFDYRAPTTLDEALSVLGQRGDEAKVMAGGQSLIPLLKLRFSRPELVVDIARVGGLNRVVRNNGHVLIGALVRHIDIERGHAELAGLPVMAEAAHWIADPLVRNRGTLVGSVCHADPAGDWGSVVLALGGEIVARSGKGERVIHSDAFFKGPFETTLRPDEIVTEVRIPAPKGRSGGAYLKLERKVGDFATVAVAVQVALSGDKIESVGIGLTAVGPNNIKAVEAEKFLRGKQATTDVIAEAARLAADAAEPNDDLRGSATYKKDVVRVFVQRGLKTAVERAKEGKR
ncbi:MAG TPA: xanthine dehydrogenase family protein subunit M [Candidatus Dormibacteraeota bacterium]|nr:xanthine dehydrogenase family protein subunit M [Candidatus Dormibacteraeota bacterium]